MKLACHFSDPTSVLCGEHQGQTGREHSRDVGDGQDRVRLVVWREARRHDGSSPLSDSVPEPSRGGEKIQRPAGSADTQVRDLGQVKQLQEFRGQYLRLKLYLAQMCEECCNSVSSLAGLECFTVSVFSLTFMK